jgi:hypothetical protein
MSEEKKETWLNYLALTTVILAVGATLATFKGGQYSTMSVLSQSQASDQWAFYQAKSLKGYMYDLQRDEMELALREKETFQSPDTRQFIESRISTYRKKAELYDKEKTSIQDQATQLEKVRDESKAHGSAFGFSVIFLQIAILLSSIAALMKKKVLWICGCSIGLAGLIFFANGFWLFFK